MLRILFCAFCLLWADVNSGMAVAADKPEIYQLHQGDRVLISVWREETLQREVVVLPDGSITFPLIGRVEVAGLSTPEVEQNITVKLKKYFPEPIVTVVIVGIDGSRAYVTGKVLHPGSLTINGPITVLQAISLVGGLDRFADENSIKVIRAKPDGQEILPVNYKDILSGKNVSTNILLKAGDTVVVP
ncbi:MAG: polysaccharide biosynthesis/export family protein [Nitrosomonadales bacterium]|nr:polysaccharide biosynthesis/export family protein [Nitrosomonadales bacterium]